MKLLTRQKGSAGVEMVYVLLFFLALIAVVQRLSSMAGASHSLSVKLQNDADKLMVDAGRPVCLTKDFAEHFVFGRSKGAHFGNNIAKRLIFTTEPICEGN